MLFIKAYASSNGGGSGGRLVSTPGGPTSVVGRQIAASGSTPLGRSGNRGRFTSAQYVAPRANRGRVAGR